MQTLWDRIELALKSRGIRSQAELARRAHLRPTTLTNWKSGQTATPRRNDLLAVAEVLGVRLEWLESGEGPMQFGDLARDSPIPYAADPPLDLPALTLAIAELEAFLVQRRMKLPPQAKAQAVVQLYATMRLWRPEALVAANVAPLLKTMLAG